MNTIGRTILLVLLFSFIESVNTVQAQVIEKSNADSLNPSNPNTETLVNGNLQPTGRVETLPADTAQTGQLYLITKNNKSEYVGFILNDDGREVLISTEKLGKIYIPKSDIKSIVKIEDKSSIIRGEYYEAGPFTTRYAFTTNALPMRKGANYALLNLYGPDAHFALSDNFSVGILSTWLASPFVFVFKYSIKTKDPNVNYSLGTLFGTSGYINNFRGLGGLHFANITLGDAKKNLTFAGGYAYLRSGSYNDTPNPGVYYSEFGYLDYYSSTNKVLSPGTRGPIFSIAGITKVGVKASFVFDSMIGIFSSSRSQVVTTPLTTPINNMWYKHVVSQSETRVVAMFLMPGMRFQTNDTRAFQISLAGVSLFKIKGYTDDPENYTFPLPMCTWFFRF